VKVDAAGISRHGFALNVAPDMDYWDGILACGLPDAPAVSLAQLLEPVPPMARVRSEVRRAFGEVFELRLTEAPAPAGLAATGA
jgi:lipoate-protein ligase B